MPRQGPVAHVPIRPPGAWAVERMGPGGLHGAHMESDGPTPSRKGCLLRRQQLGRQVQGQLVNDGAEFTIPCRLRGELVDAGERSQLPCIE